MEVESKNIAQLQSTIETLTTKILDLTFRFDTTLKSNQIIFSELENQNKALTSQNRNLAETIQNQESQILQSDALVVDLKSNFAQDISDYRCKMDIELEKAKYKLKSAQDAISKQLEYENEILRLNAEQKSLLAQHMYETSVLQKNHLMEKRNLNAELSKKLQDAVEAMKLNFKSKIANSLISTLNENKKLETYTQELVHLTKILTEQNMNLAAQIEDIKISRIK